MSLSELIDQPAAEPSDDLLRVRQEERRRLSCDLHDTLGPALAGIRLRLDTAAALLSHDPEACRLVAAAAQEIARTATEVRRIIDDLGPSDLLHAGLTGALRHLAARLGEGGGLAIALDVPERAPRLPPSLEAAAYRIAAESLTNTVKHAAASQATVRLASEGDQVVLEVTDDGVGPPRARPGGHGLPSMARRAEEVGGRCDVLPRGDGRPGTVVRTVLPGPVP
ncbi:sensor histidine kinase [Sphaerisporangium dianthi]|uniref:Sensor histidine kinase n=1 Tax=Sphaerisporangium dianthi TaxID=1436120 RepID=A0ABV9CJZ2_9ACTN